MDDAAIADFVARWGRSSGSERSNYQLFLTELCDVLGVERPEPAVADGSANAYVFEKAITFDNRDGTHSTKYADLYRRGCFICETKQGVESQQDKDFLSERQREKQKKFKAKLGPGKRGTKTYDDALRRAFGQAQSYARNLPAEEGRPPEKSVRN